MCRSPDRVDEIGGIGGLVPPTKRIRITDLDPLRYNLLLERFLNPERVSMPDFAVDFCQDRRGEVIHHVTLGQTARDSVKDRSGILGKRT